MDSRIAVLNAIALVAAACAGSEREPVRGAPTGLRPRHVVPIECSSTTAPEPLRYSRAGPLHLDFREVHLDCGHDAEGWWSLQVDGLWLNVPLKGRGGRLGWIESGVGGGGALAFVMPPVRSRGGPHMDKVMIDIFGRHAVPDDFVQFGNERFFSFHMMLPRDFESPMEGTHFIVWQLWQGSPFGPPLRMEIDSRRRAVLYLLNDRTGSHPCASNPTCTNLPSRYSGVVTLFRTRSLPLERWIPVAVRVLPRYAPAPEGRLGQVELWVGDLSRNASVYRGEHPIGYDPSGDGAYPNSAKQRRQPNRVMDVSIGIYRTAQHRSQSVFFDRVRVAPSFEMLNVAETSTN